MNNRDLDKLIDRIEDISIEVDRELKNLKDLRAAREIPSNTDKLPAQGKTKTRNKKLCVGDEIKVTRGRNQGVIGRIVKETPSQYEINSEHVVGNFRKWKDNVKRA